MAAVDANHRPFIVLADRRRHGKAGLEQAVTLEAPAIGAGMGLEPEHRATQQDRIAELVARLFDVLNCPRLAGADQRVARRRDQIRVTVLAWRVPQRRVALARRRRPDDIELRKVGVGEIFEGVHLHERVAAIGSSAAGYRRQ